MRFFTDPGTRLNEAMDLIKVHDHFALIYQSPEEKFETLLPFVRSGLERGDRYMYISSEADAQLSLEVLQGHGIDTSAALSDGSLLLITPNDVPRGESFQPDAFIEFLSHSVAQAQADGFNNFRLCVEKIWTLGSLFDISLMVDYEAKLDLFSRQNNITALCAYDARRFSAAVMRDVIRSHPKVVMQGLLCSNYAYLPPDELLHPNQLEFEVQRLLRGMLETELHLYDLQMQNEMFMAMFKNSPAMVYVKDRQGRYLMLNPSGTRFMQRSQEEILGHTDEELLAPESAQWCRAADAKALASAPPLVT
jgi:PAS domain-containing protein